jgi:hypothetical protein
LEIKPKLGCFAAVHWCIQHVVAVKGAPNGFASISESVIFYIENLVALNK